MTVIKICGAALTALLFALVLRRLRPEYGALLSGTAGILLLGVGVAALAPVLLYLRELAEASAFSEYAVILFKVVGIGALTELTAGMCRDAGETGLATQVGFFGRAEILLLTLPLLREAAELAASILNI